MHSTESCRGASDCIILAVELPCLHRKDAPDCCVTVLQRRNPLALAHFANHPPPGRLPNVVVASYDAHLNEGKIGAALICSGTQCRASIQN